MTDYESFLKQIYTRYSGNIKYGLERMHSILAEMDNPESKLQGIHIAGTNGKGSTSAMCEAISLRQGQTTGLNTSPHLIDYRERFRINGVNITLEELMRIYNQWRDCFSRNDASFFEITTAIAFYCFFINKLQTSIFEVGLGGRLDGTNPFNSTISIITTIALDHPKTLGDTLEKIAYEKAGIIKKEVPVILGKIGKEASRVIKDTADRNHSPCYAYGVDFFVENIHFDHGLTCFDLISTNKSIPLPERVERLSTNLIGKHQAINAALALTAYSMYCERIDIGFDLGQASIGLNNVNWMGRMQIIGQSPLRLVDCAHNEEGIVNLVDNINTLFPNKRIRIVLAILRDKDFRKMITLLCSVAYKVYISKNTSERAADHEEQVEIAREYGVMHAADESVVLSYQRALNESAKDDIIVVTGSIYTVSEIVALYER